MIHLVWPWALAALPLPLVLRLALPAARPRAGAALHLPPAVFDHLSGPAGTEVRGARPSRLRLVLALAAWALLVVAVARPVWIDDASDQVASGRDMMLVVDISGSMRRMDFGSPDDPVDRLGMVKRIAGDFIARRDGDRLGLVLFGARPYLRAPLTFDNPAVRALLNEAEVAMAGEYTALGDALALAVKRMRTLEAETRVAVVLTDGANNAGAVAPAEAAHLARAHNVRVYTVGIGRQDTAAPNPYGAWSAEGAADFDRAVLEAMAEATGGAYFHAADAEGLADVYRRLDALEPTPGAEAKAWIGTPLHAWPAAAALLLAFASGLRRGGRP